MEKEIKNLEPSDSNIGADPYWEVRREAFRNGYDAAESDYWKKFHREAAKDLLPFAAALCDHRGVPEAFVKMSIKLANELTQQLKEDEK